MTSVMKLDKNVKEDLDVSEITPVYPSTDLDNTDEICVATTGGKPNEAKLDLSVDSVNDKHHSTKTISDGRLIRTHRVQYKPDRKKTDSTSGIVPHYDAIASNDLVCETAAEAAKSPNAEERLPISSGSVTHKRNTVIHRSLRWTEMKLKAVAVFMKDLVCRKARRVSFDRADSVSTTFFRMSKKSKTVSTKSGHGTGNGDSAKAEREMMEEALAFASRCLRRAITLQRATPPDMEGASKMFENALQTYSRMGLFYSCRNAIVHFEYANHLGKTASAVDAERHLRIAVSIFQVLNAKMARRYNETLRSLAVIADKEDRFDDAKHLYDSILAVFQVSKLYYENLRTAVVVLNQSLRSQGRDEETVPVQGSTFLSSAN